MFRLAGITFPDRPQRPYPCQTEDYMADTIVDTHVGMRLKLRRNLLGMSQTQLANAIGLTFQQVQKYERGVNRIGASRLFRMAEALDVPISFFFDDLPEESAHGRPTPPEQLSSDSMTREVLEFIRAYQSLPVDQRRAVYALVKELTKEA
jgi:transcriptional regulator with XRE-family HTH domain